MKVAIAGSSNVAKYLVEEVSKHGHQVIQLTRSIKPDQKAIEQRPTDYSVGSLVDVLEDCDALVSTIADFLNPPIATKVHLDMLEACKRSTKCRTFVPSEWTSNVEDYPEQPMFLVEHNKIIHERLKQETSIRWTIICNSWFADYVLPENQRYLRNIGQLWPMDYEKKVFTIYGPGTQPVDFTFVRDIAKAVAILLNSKEPWEPHTYVSSEQLTWNELFAIVKTTDPEWTSQKKPLTETLRLIADTKNSENVYTGQFEILSYSGASTFPKERVERQLVKYFQGLQFRTVKEVLAAAADSPNEVF